MSMLNNIYIYGVLDNYTKYFIATLCNRVTCDIDNNFIVHGVPLRSCQCKQMKHVVQEILAGNCSNSCIGDFVAHVAISNFTCCFIFSNSISLGIFSES